MMVKAMEVAGLNGSFRSDAENVMRCLRQNKDSVTAMLEAFVHDPLISWRLMAEAEAGGGEEEGQGGAGERVGREYDDDDDDDDEDDEGTKGTGEGGGKSTSSKEAANMKKKKQMRRLSKRSTPFRRASSTEIQDEDEDEAPVDKEELNELANRTLIRINQKLNGTDFKNEAALDVSEQVDKLIRQATSTANLCVLFQGWCSFW